MKYHFFVTLAILFTHKSLAQETYAEKLGYPKGKKVIIFHIDDAGMSYEANQGTILAMEKGVANSTSVMMPCGWVPAYMKYLQQNPTTDAGVHLTLTSEWKGYRWFPLSGKEKVPGLLDKEGAMWSNVPDVVKHATADEVEASVAEKSGGRRVLYARLAGLLARAAASEVASACCCCLACSLSPATRATCSDRVLTCPSRV